MPGRYVFHDLVRAYATELREDSAEATHRLFDHYLSTAYAAARLQYPNRDPITIDPPKPGVARDEPTEQRQAAAWLTAEQSTLLAVIRQAAELGFDAHTWQLTWTLWDFYFIGGARWREWVTVQSLALEATRRLADQPAQALAHRGLARAHTELGNYTEAHVHSRHALDLLHSHGDQTGEAHVRNSLAHLCEKQDDHRQALTHVQEALRLYQAAGHRPGEADALNNLGWYHTKLGEYEHALSYCQKSAALFRDLGNGPRDMADVEDSLGFLYYQLGQFEEATVHPDADRVRAKLA